MERKIRILICKPGLDGHDRGAKVVASALRDAGFEVIYTGLRQTPQMVAESAIQQDLDAIGLSLHSAAHMTIFPKVMNLLKEEGADLITFASSSAVEHFLDLGLPLPENLKTASIGPVTSAALRADGRDVDIEAEQHDIPGLVAAIEAYYAE